MVKKLKHTAILLVFALILLWFQASLFSYSIQMEALKVEHGPEIDGSLSDAVWMQAKIFTNFKMIYPDTGIDPTEKTELRILYDRKSLYIGVHCFTKDPSAITVTSLQHDQEHDDSDLVKILLDPFQDRRNAYVFIVNAGGARTDGLAAGGEHMSTNWDGIWDAKTKRLEDGWSAEIKIPFKTISFNPKLTAWGFNAERYIAREMETCRLSGISKDSFFYNPAEAALLEGIHEIKQGKGITIKPYLGLETTQKTGDTGKRKWEVDGGVDVYKHFTPNLVGVLTVNTDFAETEADDRQLNLTRFSLYYPEKRSFFLEGSEIFSFGNPGGFFNSFIPFFSRRISLYEGRQVPMAWGTKIFGKIGDTNLAFLDVQTKAFDGLPSKNFFAGRIYQNLFEQGKAGIIFTSGEPGESGITNTLVGFDFKYATSRFLKNKNFTAIGWWVYNWNSLKNGKHHGHGFKIEYPNDLIDLSANYSYYGDSLNPGLGFLPRRGVQVMDGSVKIRPRPEGGLLKDLFRQFMFQSYFSLYWDLKGNLETSRVSVSLLGFYTQSGEWFEFYVIPFKEVLHEPFEISEGVVIQPGSYPYTRYQLNFSSAGHRIADVRVEYEWGGFYNGKLTTSEISVDFKLKGHVGFGGEVEFARGNLPQGKFKETLYRGKVDFYLNANLGLMTYIQYDSVSENIGANIRFKWQISPGNTIYLVYNKSWEKAYEMGARFFPVMDRGVFKIQLSWRP